MLQALIAPDLDRWTEADLKALPACLIRTLYLANVYLFLNLLFALFWNHSPRGHNGKWLSVWGSCQSLGSHAYLELAASQPFLLEKSVSALCETALLSVFKEWASEEKALERLLSVISSWLTLLSACTWLCCFVFYLLSLFWFLRSNQVSLLPSSLPQRFLLPESLIAP